MIYEYECKGCGETKERLESIENRDEPCHLPCTKCGGEIKRLVPKSMSIDWNGKYTTLQRAGDGWNDVQNKIKAASGKANTIHTK